jgi:hypothetical protein
MMARYIGYSYFYEDYKSCEKHFINALTDDIGWQKAIDEMSYIKLTAIVSLWIANDG